MANYRKVIVGSTAVASRYFGKAEQMLLACERDGTPKKVFRGSSVLIIAKTHGGQRKAIFITTDLLFLYTSKVTVGNIATFGGWVGASLQDIFTLDFSALPDAASVGAIEITDVVNKKGYLYLRSSSFNAEPPFAEYPLTVKDGTAFVGAPQVINYAGAPINFRTLHRAVDRDYFYTTTDPPTLGFDAGAAIHQRLWGDEAATVSLKGTLPEPLPGFYWPPVGFDAPFSRYFQVVQNSIYLIESKTAFQQIYFWELLEDNTFTNLAAFDHYGFGGLSVVEYGCMLHNSVNTVMRISASEWVDTTGAPSDLEYVIELSVGLPVDFSFTPGAVMGYTGRTATNKTRIKRMWLVSPGVYAFHIENTNQPAAIADQIPDGVLLYDTTVVAPALELVYQAPAGRAMRSPIVDNHRPELVLCGEKDRAGGKNPKVFLLNMATKKVTKVTDTTNTLPSSQFVR